MNRQLLTQRGIEPLLGSLVNRSANLKIEIGEDRCFGSAWVDIGQITVLEISDHSYENQIEFGAYTWQLPTRDVLETSISNGLGITLEQKNNVKDKIIEAQKIIEEGLQDVFRRTGLLLPNFDTYTMTNLPFEQTTTLVADTSAIRQGAVTFFSRVFQPWVRIKVPLVAHMEIINKADAYIAKRRSTPNYGKNDEEKLQKEISFKVSVLENHVASQGSQRALLRFEFSPDIQVEKDSQESIKVSEAFSATSNSHRDRLIVETAKSIQNNRPHQSTYLLTSDQGMAKVAMSEGVNVFFFEARKFPRIYGEALTGMLFQPFKSSVYYVPLPEVLWELAVTFGSARLSNELGDSIEIWGIGGPAVDAGWQPFHVREDLLWVTYQIDLLTGDPSPLPEEEPASKPLAPQLDANTPMLKSVELKKIKARTTRDNSTFYRFTPAKLLNFIDLIDQHEALPRERLQELLDIKALEEIRRYENLLASGKYITVSKNQIRATSALHSFRKSLQTTDHVKLCAGLMKIPAFFEFSKALKQFKVFKEDSEDFPVPLRSRLGYFNLGEAASLLLKLPDKTIIYTENEPELKDFIKISLTSYREISKKRQTDWVLVGEWLEELATKYKIHPLVSKALLHKARTELLIRAYYEGSTPDRRFDDHTLWVLSISRENKPEIDKVYLYQGDFISPGTSAVRIKLQGANDAT